MSATLFFEERKKEAQPLVPSGREVVQDEERGGPSKANPLKRGVNEAELFVPESEKNPSFGIRFDSLNILISQVRRQVAKKVGKPATRMQLWYMDSKLPLDQTLEEANISDGDTVEYLLRDSEDDRPEKRARTDESLPGGNSMGGGIPAPSLVQAAVAGATQAVAQVLTEQKEDEKEEKGEEQIDIGQDGEKGELDEESEEEGKISASETLNALARGTNNMMAKVRQELTQGPNMNVGLVLEYLKVITENEVKTREAGQALVDEKVEERLEQIIERAREQALADITNQLGGVLEESGRTFNDLPVTNIVINGQNAQSLRELFRLRQEVEAKSRLNVDDINNMMQESLQGLEAQNTRLRNQIQTIRSNVESELTAERNLIARRIDQADQANQLVRMQQETLRLREETLDGREANVRERIKREVEAENAEEMSRIRGITNTQMETITELQTRIATLEAQLEEADERKTDEPMQSEPVFDGRPAAEFIRDLEGQLERATTNLNQQLADNAALTKSEAELRKQNTALRSQNAHAEHKQAEGVREQVRMQMEMTDDFKQAMEDILATSAFNMNIQAKVQDIQQRFAQQEQQLNDRFEALTRQMETLRPAASAPSFNINVGNVGSGVAQERSRRRAPQRVSEERARELRQRRGARDRSEEEDTSEGGERASPARRGSGGAILPRGVADSPVFNVSGDEDI